MAREIRTEIEIEAPAGRVWAVLADLSSYPDWNPFIIRARGELREGGKLAVTIRPPGTKARTFRPTVTSCLPGRKLVWLGRLGIPGIFDGEHIHELQPLDEGRTVYVQREVFSGVLPPLTPRVLEATKEGFRAMNAALKARAEDS